MRCCGGGHGGSSSKRFFQACGPIPDFLACGFWLPVWLVATDGSFCVVQETERLLSDPGMFSRRDLRTSLLLADC